MPRPGTDVQIADPVLARGAVLDTGQGFMLGSSQRGAADKAIELHSLRQFERACGPRAGAPMLHDSVRAFFTERGSTLYFGRLLGDGAAPAQATLGSLEVAASSPGEWGNEVSVAAETEGGVVGAAEAAARDLPPLPNGDGNGEEGEGPTIERPSPTPRVRIVVRLAGDVVERSQLITTAEQAISWSIRSDYVSIGAEDPEEALEEAEATLEGGANGGDVEHDDVAEKLDRCFPYTLGPGQVLYPGETDVAVHDIIRAHCEQNRRCALLDLTSSPDATVLAADTIAGYGKAGVRFSAPLAPPIIYPGPAGPISPVIVPYSAVQAGIIARQDRITENPNQPAAGVNGESLAALGLAHDYTDDEREALNEAGATLAKIRYGRVRTYGSRTGAGPDEPTWRFFGGSRVIMAITHEADAVAERYVHRQIDGQGHIFVELEKDLTGVCMRYFGLDALYGEEPSEAFMVDARSPNTLETIAAGEIHALIGLKTSPSGEWVYIELSKYPIDAALAAAA